MLTLSGFVFFPVTGQFSPIPGTKLSAMKTEIVQVFGEHFKSSLSDPYQKLVVLHFYSICFNEGTLKIDSFLVVCTHTPSF